MKNLFLTASYADTAALFIDTVHQEHKEKSVAFFATGSHDITFYRLQALNKKRLRDIIRESANRGKVYICESVCAIIFASNRAYASLMVDASSAHIRVN